jgi:nucleoredoxin
MKSTLRTLVIVAFSLGLIVPSSARADYFGKIEPRLIQVVDGKKGDYKKPSTSPKYTAIYFSAHWCPPCRAFTPKLVEWYQEFKGKHDNFELVFASSDKSEEAQIEYMTETKMPWPAMKFGTSKDPNVKKYAASGIPYLVLIDENGKDLTGEKDNEWQAPQGVLTKIEEIVGGKK